MTLDEFLARYPVRVPVDRSDCWPWIGGTGGNYKGRLRYGRIRFDGRACYAHRVVYQLVHGPLDPDQQLVRNVARCLSDERCCNPDHWIVIDKRKKLRLLKQQRRLSCGKKHSLAVALGRRRTAPKLTLEKAREIRASTEPARIVADRYGIDLSMVYYVRRGQCWAEATPFSGLGR